jgi:hypothetical protein
LHLIGYSATLHSCIELNTYTNYLIFWQYGETPLHMAVKNSSCGSTNLLLEHGALLETKANVWSTCFWFFSGSISLRLTCYVLCHSINEYHDLQPSPDFLFIAFMLGY